MFVCGVLIAESNVVISKSCHCNPPEQMCKFLLWIYYNNVLWR